MHNSLWVKMHGGTTHFPIALIIASTLFELAGSLLPDNTEKSRRAGFRTAGLYTLVLGAVGALGAVISGLLISHGQLWGRGNLSRHHLFIWPAFGLLIGLAVWRLVIGKRTTNRAFKVYLVASMLTGALVATAGYWGGELLLNG
jgi:uncharacterized membrane protein